MAQPPSIDVPVRAVDHRGEPITGELGEFEFDPGVSVGPATILGGGVTVAAYVAAVVAIFNGARDVETITLVIVGTIALVVTLVGRFAQAIAIAKARATAPAPALLEAGDAA